MAFPSDSVLIEGLPTTIDDVYIQNVFGAYGTIKSFQILAVDLRMQGSAIVSFSSVDEARCIIHFLNGKIPQGLASPVSISFQQVERNRMSGLDGTGDIGGKGGLGGAATMCSWSRNNAEGPQFGGGDDGRLLRQFVEREYHLRSNAREEAVNKWMIRPEFYDRHIHEVTSWWKCQATSWWARQNRDVQKRTRMEEVCLEESPVQQFEVRHFERELREVERQQRVEAQHQERERRKLEKRKLYEEVQCQLREQREHRERERRGICIAVEIVLQEIGGSATAAEISNWIAEHPYYMLEHANIDLDRHATVPERAVLYALRNHSDKFFCKHRSSGIWCLRQKNGAPPTQSSPVPKDPPDVTCPTKKLRTTMSVVSSPTSAASVSSSFSLSSSSEGSSGGQKTSLNQCNATTVPRFRLNRKTRFRLYGKTSFAVPNT